MRIHCLQHVPFEGPAGIADWAAARGHQLATTGLYTGAQLPNQDDLDWLVVMGGPMGVHDDPDFNWLTSEKAFLAEAIEMGKTVVGVCLGAQLIAHVLGARIYPNHEKEIGWLPIELTPTGVGSGLFDGLPERFDVFHWHGDTFELPHGAIHLARSEACTHQAFNYQDRVLGLQCHLESTPESVRQITSHGAVELVPGNYVQSAERILAAKPDDYALINRALWGILDRLAVHSGGQAAGLASADSR
jgi:GMP synthase-like glutamine amidotransferase